MSEREIVELADLRSTLERVRLCGVSEDKWVWEIEGSGLFTCKSLFKHMIDKPTYSPLKLHHFIWKISILNKVRVFSGLLILKKLKWEQSTWSRRLYFGIFPIAMGDYEG